MSSRNPLASNIVDLIASGATPGEIAEAVRDGYLAASAERIDDYRSVIGASFFEEAG